MHDLCIIGGGPAGYSAAEKAASAGFSTVLIEKELIGGVCLNEGCIPSKALLYSTKLFSQATSSAKFGVTAAHVTFDLKTAMTRKQQVVDRLRRGVEGMLKKKGVTVIKAAAMIQPPRDGVFPVAAGNDSIESKRLLICTGSAPIKLALPGAGQPWVYTNREMLALDRIPADLVVIGGGVIGLELALFCAEAGSRVTVIEMLPSIGGGIEPALAAILKSELEAKGLRILCNSRAVAIGDHQVTFEQDAKQETIPAEIALMSVGRRPAVAGYGLESCGVAIDKGAIGVDAHGRTSVAGIWAAGDVNGRSMLAHTAYREADVCVNDMLGVEDGVNYDSIPMVIYTHPEVASVGLTHAEAVSRGLAVSVAELPMTYSGRYCAEHERERGMCKAVAESGTGRLLGVHMIGDTCSEMIVAAAAMIERHMSVAEIHRIVFPHPTVAEIIKETVAQIKV
jgi:dihydrolipoamide dehydrogenase